MFLAYSYPNGVYAIGLLSLCHLLALLSYDFISALATRFSNTFLQANL